MFDRMAIEIRQATEDDWATVRAVRLRALADAPSAFSSRFEDERDRPESFWRDRLASVRACTFLAFYEGDVVGLVSAFLLPEDASHAHMVSMWVAPERRRAGVATAILDSILDWSRLQRAQSVELWVTE